VQKPAADLRVKLGFLQPRNVCRKMATPSLPISIFVEAESLPLLILVVSRDRMLTTSILSAAPPNGFMHISTGSDAPMVGSGA
jgi:hypothetical protein